MHNPRTTGKTNNIWDNRELEAPGKWPLKLGMHIFTYFLLPSCRPDTQTARLTASHKITATTQQDTDKEL